MVCSVIISLIFTCFFPVIGSYITKPFINKIGKKGTGIVTSIESTNNRYNKQRVMNYLIMLKKEDGSIIETSFTPNNKNVGYPQDGQEFTVKYLPGHPQAFIILTNDDSPYASTGECAYLGRKLNDARIKYEFDPANMENRLEYADLIEKYMLENRCFPDTTFDEHHRKEIERLRNKQ